MTSRTVIMGASRPSVSVEASLVSLLGMPLVDVDRSSLEMLRNNNNKFEHEFGKASKPLLSWSKMSCFQLFGDRDLDPRGFT